MTDTRSITLASNLDEIERVTAFVHRLSSLIGCDAEKEHQIMLVLTEAVTNAIIHGNKKDPSKSVGVTAIYEPGTLNLRVKDQGKGFNPDILPDPRNSENLYKSSGRGVWLMREFSDHLSYSENGSRVDIRFDLKS